MHRIILRDAPGGERHHLDGRPIHCGDVLELQTHIGWLPVRYEASWYGEAIKRAILVANVPGANLVIVLHTDAFYRWPS